MRKRPRGYRPRGWPSTVRACGRSTGLSWGNPARAAPCISPSGWAFRPQLLRRAHREVYGGEENGAAREERMRVPKSRLVRTAPLRQGPDPSEKFSMGDSVELLATGETGHRLPPGG